MQRDGAGVLNIGSLSGVRRLGMRVQDTLERTHHCRAVTEWHTVHFTRDMPVVSNSAQPLEWGVVHLIQDTPVVLQPAQPLAWDVVHSTSYMPVVSHTAQSLEWGVVHFIIATRLWFCTRDSPTDR